MEDILGYVLSKVLDVIVPDLRAIWGSWGCLMATILVAGVLFWFVPAYMLDLPGDDWKTWLVVGPLATIAVVVMVAGTYGLTRRSRSSSGERASSTNPESQEPGDWTVTEASPPQNIEELLQDLQDRRGTISLEAEQHLDRAYDHAESGEFEDALSECAAAVRYDPGYAEAHNLRGIVLEELGRTREAVAAYRQAVYLDPEFSEARENLAEVEDELRVWSSSE